MTGAAEQGSTAETAAALDEGRAAFAARDLDAAHDAFRRAHRRTPADPRAMSWYAVTLVLVERNSNLGVVLCEQALRQAGPDPELLLNQARVHLGLNQRERAVRAIVRGLELWPDHPRLCAARDAIGTRRAPVVPFLSRNNPLNRLLGLARHRWNQRSGPVYELSPVALGEPGASPGSTSGPAPVEAPGGEPARS